MAFSLPRSTTDGPLAAVRAPGSKSATQRAALLAAIAPGRSILAGPLRADDTERMRVALGRCGATIRGTTTWTVDGGAPPHPDVALDLGASGTTLRFLVPWLAATAEGTVRLRGTKRLLDRPLDGLAEALTPARIVRVGPTELVLTPGRPPADVAVDARASSQFVSGLALARAAMGGGTVTFGEVPSASYLELTATWMEAFGVGLHREGRVWLVTGRPRPSNVEIPGDWSSAAAFLVAAAVTGRRGVVAGLDPRDGQGDRALVGLLESVGAAPSWGEDGVTITGRVRRGFDADLSASPDLAPVLVAAAALAPGPSCFTGLQTLRDKECDRFSACLDLVRWTGGRASGAGGHTLEVRPSRTPGAHGVFPTRDDHRMVFAASVAGLRVGGRITQPWAVAKTVPGFWSHWASMLAGSPSPA